tara:strand:- start:5190 stop:5798 length:609 start_codon:yes stop_codon:yes gene_type:complete
MGKQATPWRATNIVRALGWVGWVAIYVLVALQILTFGGKLNMDPLALSISLFVAMLVAMYADKDRQQKVSRHKGGLIAAAIAVIIVIVGLFAEPFGSDTNFAMFKFGILGLIVVLGLSDIRARFTEHGRYSSLVWPFLAMGFYMLTIICVFERDAFTQLPLILQSNLPVFLEFPYVTLAFFTAGAGATVMSRVREFRLRQPE